MRRSYRAGQRLCVAAVSGGFSSECGTVVSRHEVRTDGRGVPRNVEGAYKPVNWRREVAVRLDNGELITMFKDLLFPPEHPAVVKP